MKCIIVDDDEMARASLEMLCNKISDLEVISSYDNGVEALSAIQTQDLDLIFLDIEMPDLSGMDIIKSVDKLPQIIFVTGHSEYAVEAFEHHVTDFLVKPIDLPRLIKAVNRAKELNSKEKGKDDLNGLFVKVDGRLVQLNYDDILYIESIGDYVIFHTEKKERFIVHSTMKNIDEKIKSPQFLKVHRSYIVNLSKIIDIEESNLLIKEKVIPISRAHKPILMNRIKTL